MIDGLILSIKIKLISLAPKVKLTVLGNQDRKEKQKHLLFPNLLKVFISLFRNIADES